MLVGLCGTVLGALLGNWFAIGIEKRRDRNAARLEVWKFLNREDIRRTLMAFLRFPCDDWPIVRYQAVVSRHEWQRFQRRLNEIKRIRALEVLGEYEPSTGMLPTLRARTDEEKEMIDLYWNELLDCTKLRWVFLSS